MGLRSLFKDLGEKVNLRLHSDASAAIGIARRRGMGKLRHLDCEDLWIQQRLRTKDLELVKVLGTSNPADALTKYIDHKSMSAALAKINMIAEDGRPLSAPEAAT